MTQTKLILKHLREGRSLNAIEALADYGCLRLAARINDLRNEGWPISTYTIKRGQRNDIAEYRLDESGI